MARRAYVERDELPPHFDIPDDVSDDDAEAWVHEQIEAFYECVSIEIVEDS